MKKFFSALLAAAMTVSAMSVTAFAAQSNRDVMIGDNERVLFGAIPSFALGKDVSLYSKGDVNMDGVVNAKDAMLVLHETNLYSVLEFAHFLDEQQRALADVDPQIYGKDPDNINTGDATLILHYANYVQIGGKQTVEEFVKDFHAGARFELET